MKSFIVLSLLSFCLYAQTPSTDKKTETVAELTPTPESKKPTGFVVVEINLHEMSWQELGLEQEVSFTNPLKQSWLKYLQENNKASHKEIKSCVDSCLSYFSQWQEKEPALLSGLPQDEYVNGAWFKISFDLKRIHNRSQFRWEGRVVLLDVNSKTILMSYDLPPEEKEWHELSQKQLNSALATRMYRSALPALESIASKWEEDLAYTRASKLVIKGARHLGQIQKLVEEIKTRGSSLGLILKWDYVQSSEGRFLCLYRGEEKMFTDLLSQLKELKSSEANSLGYETIGMEHIITIKTK